MTEPLRCSFPHRVAGHERSDREKEDRVPMSDATDPPRWDQSSAIGIELVDYEHRMIFSALNDFLITVQAELGERLSRQVLVVLCNYTRAHCENEENIMREIDYDLLDAHRQQHRDYLDRLQNLRRHFGDGQDIRADLITLFRDFLHRHVRTDDRGMADAARSGRPTSAGWLAGR